MLIEVAEGTSILKIAGYHLPLLIATLVGGN